MSLAAIRKRLDRIEQTRGGSHPRKVLRIVTDDDEDRTRQLAGLDLSGLFLIERRLIDPAPRSLHASASQTPADAWNGTRPNLHTGAQQRSSRITRPRARKRPRPSTTGTNGCRKAALT
jgi:hypothetical protein